MDKTRTELLQERADKIFEEKKEKVFRIGVDWTMCSEIKIKAKSLEEAIEIANKDNSIPLPEGTYIDGSFIANRSISEYFEEEDYGDSK